MKVNEKNIAELKFSMANEECLKNRLANQRDEIQENLKALEQIKAGIYILEKIRKFSKTKIKNGETLSKLNWHLF